MVCAGDSFAAGVEVDFATVQKAATVQGDIAWILDQPMTIFERISNSRLPVRIKQTRTSWSPVTPRDVPSKSLPPVIEDART